MPLADECLQHGAKVGVGGTSEAVGPLNAYGRMVVAALVGPLVKGRLGELSDAIAKLVGTPDHATILPGQRRWAPAANGNSDPWPSSVRP